VIFRQRLHLFGEDTLVYRSEIGALRHASPREPERHDMATTTHLQNARLPFRVDLNPVETLRAIGSGEPHNPRR
jgi:hypothetical protein